MTAERYTAVFTGLLSLKKPGEYTYLRMSDDPVESGHYTVNRSRLPYAELGREIPFADLPEDCKNLVLDTYRQMWNLKPPNPVGVVGEPPKNEPPYPKNFFKT